MSSSSLQLVGLVTYYGKHYSTFFYHTKLCSWIYFDDATVREIGPHWEQVVDRCLKGHFQPLLLLYANPNGTAINATTAPKTVTMVSHPQNSKSHHFRHYHPHHAQPHLQHNNNYGKTNIYQNIIHLTRKDNANMSCASASNLTKEKSHRPPKLNLLTSSVTSSWKNNTRNHQIYGTMKLPKRNVYRIHHKPGSMDDLINPYNSTSDDAPDSPIMRSSLSSCYFSDLGETDSGYISRKTVEGIIAQKFDKRVNGQPHQRSSISSVDSYNELLLKKSNEDNHLHLPPKACSLQRRDSGNSSNSSGDRFSGSSNSSTTSRDDNLYSNSSKRSSKSLTNQSENRNGSSASDAGYDTFSLSSNGSYPSIGQTTPTKQSQFLNHARLSQIPEDAQLIELIKNSSDFLDCEKLCNESDVLLLKSIEKEQEGDLLTAAALSDSAAHKARSALAAPYSNSKMLVSAKMKHSICVMRSASLHKRLKEIEMEEKRRLKMEANEAAMNGHSRQSSRDSGHARHSRQNSRDGSVKENKKESKDKKAMPDYVNGKAIQLYGTLPKKSSSSSSSSSSKKKMLASPPSVSSNTSAAVANLIGKSATYAIEKRHSVPSLFTDALRSIGKGDKNFDVKSDVMSICSSRSMNIMPKNSPNDRAGRIHSMVRDSDLSDNYFSEWEAIRENKKNRKALKRTLSGLSNGSNTGGKSSETDTYADSSDISLATGKKQHKVRRKLLLGNILKRKNRSLPDLRENCQSDGTNNKEKGVNDDLITTKTVAKISRKGFHQGMGIYQRSALLQVNPPVLEQSKIDKLPRPVLNNNTNGSLTASTQQQQCQSSSLSSLITNKLHNHHRPLPQPLSSSSHRLQPALPSPNIPESKVHPIPQPSSQPPPPPPRRPTTKAVNKSVSDSRNSKCENKFTENNSANAYTNLLSDNNKLATMLPRAPTPPRPRADNKAYANFSATKSLSTNSASRVIPTPPLPSTFETVNACNPSSPPLGIEPNEELPPPPECFLQELREKRGEIGNNSILGRLTSEKLANREEEPCDEVDSSFVNKNHSRSPNCLPNSALSATDHNKSSSVEIKKPEEKPLSSVKNLALKFQNMSIQKTFTASPSISSSASSSSLRSSSQTFSDPHTTQTISLPSIQKQSNLNSTSLTTATTPLNDSIQKNQPNNLKVLSPSPSPSITSSSSLRQGLRVVALLGSSLNPQSCNNTCNSISESPASPKVSSPSTLPNVYNGPGRPGRPPDYETAMKRLSQQKAELNGSVTQNKMVPIVVSPPKTSQMSMPCLESPSINRDKKVCSPLNDIKCNLDKELIPRTNEDQLDASSNKTDVTLRKDSFKKSVSFSDHVTLVAPAEDDEEEHLPNPLLERVLGKKIS